jgi:hypothetical protein
VIGALKSELLKLTTARTWWVLLITMFGYVAFVSGLLAGVFGSLGDQLGSSSNAPQLPDSALPPLIFSTVTSVGYVIPLILGAISVTSEFRYQTLTPTFLAGPRRGVVLGAKVVVLAGAGAVFALGALVASMGIGGGVLAASGIDPQFDSADTWLLAGRIVIATALWAVVGVGVGSLITNQVASIVVVLAFTQFVEPILRFGTSIWDWTAAVGKFLPGAASDALVGSSVFTTMGAASASTQTLDWWQGGLVLLGLGAVLAGAGFLTSWRKDVT